MGWDDDDDWAKLDDSSEAREQRRRGYASTREIRRRALRWAYGVLAILLILVLVVWYLN